MNDTTEAKRIALATIPPEAVQAAAYQVCKGAGDDFVCKVMCDGCKDVARQALIDALHAWPGMWHVKGTDFDPRIILPLTQGAAAPLETRDE